MGALRSDLHYVALISCHPIRDPAKFGESLMLKLECLQVTGSFKARRAIKFKSLSSDDLARGIITASGGNHGLAVAYAGWLAKVPTRIYLPITAPAEKIEKLRNWGAEVVIDGGAWDDSIGQPCPWRSVRPSPTFTRSQIPW